MDQTTTNTAVPELYWSGTLGLLKRQDGTLPGFAISDGWGHVEVLEPA